MKKHALQLGIVLLILALLPLCGQADRRISTKDELISYLKTAASFKSDNIRFEYADSLYSGIDDSDWMGEVLNEAGIFTASWRYGNNTCTLSNINYMPAHTYCTTEDQVLSALRSASNGSVNIRVSSGLYAKLTANDFRLLHELEGKAGLDSRRMSYYSSSRLFLYTEVKYAANFSQVSTISQVKQLMSSYRTQNKTEYTIQCTASLYKQLTKNNFEQMYLIEGACGFSDRNLSYNDSKYTFYYSQIVYASNFTSVQTLNEFKQCMYDRTQNLTGEFTIHCTAELYDQLSRDSFQLTNDIESNCGIYQRQMTYSNSNKTIHYTNIEYHPGFYVARCIRLGRTGQLTGKKLTLYREAKSILQQINPSRYSDKVELQFALQDAIMDRTVYYKGYTAGEQDTAIGALLNGRCECDGYADAFYLLADMAGFDVHFQTGQDYKDGENHLWNIIRHNGKWYFTDLTWCDDDDGFSSHMYTNIGRDIAATAYRWNEQGMLVQLASSSAVQANYHSRNNLIFSSYKEAGSYVEKKLRAGNKHVEILVKKPSGENIESTVKKVKNYIDTGYKVSYHHTDEYVCFVFSPYK